MASEAERDFLKQVVEEGISFLPQTDWRFGVYDAAEERFVIPVKGLDSELVKSLDEAMKDEAARIRAERAPMDVCVAPAFKVHVLNYAYAKDWFGNPGEDLRFGVTHEIGHFAIETKTRLSNRNASESAADVYALLMHMKHDGTESSLEFMASVIQHEREIKLILGDIEHFTSPAVQALYEARNTIDFENLTAEKAIDISIRLAERHKFSDEQIADLTQLFNDVHARSDEESKTDPYAYSRTLADLLSERRGEIHGARTLAEVFLKMAQINKEYAPTPEVAATWAKIEAKITAPRP